MVGIVFHIVIVELYHENSISQSHIYIKNGIIKIQIIIYIYDLTNKDINILIIVFLLT